MTNPSTLAAALLVTWGALAKAGPAHAQEVWRLDVSQPISYYIAEAAPETGVREEDRMLARWALEAWGALASPPVRFEPADRGAATIRVFWAPPVGGAYGQMRARSIDGRRGADIFVRPDTEGLGTDVARAARGDPLFRDTIVYLTCVHELGHAFGLAHTRSFADIMYSFQWGGDVVAYFGRFRHQLDDRAGIPAADPFSTEDRAAFRALYPEPAPVD